MNENIFTVELGRYGFMLDTEWCYIALSWQLIIVSSLALIGYKIYKRTRQNKIDTPTKCNTTNDANDDLWGNNE